VPTAYSATEKLDISAAWYLLQLRPRASIDPATGTLEISANLHLVVCKTPTRFIRRTVLFIQLRLPKL
jgi:hypothetical protein